MQSSNQKHFLKAWTYTNEFVPTLYVEGDILTNGEKPVVELKERTPQGTAHEDLMLEFSKDVYDPNGSSRLTVTPFKKVMSRGTEYTSVIIVPAKEKIHLEIEQRQREKM